MSCTAVRSRLLALLELALIAFDVPSLVAQAPSQKPASQEMTTEESKPQFTLGVERNVVLVRVVVRDKTGQPVKDLRKEDFVLRDEGKPQAITHFSIEGSGTAPQTENPAAPQEDLSESSPTPLRFLGLFFDDSYLRFEDIAQAREAAKRFLRAQARPEERVAVFTTSGVGVQDFTEDREKVEAAMLKIMPRPRAAPRAGQDCPDITDYQADLIYNHQDHDALALAVDDDVRVCQDDPRFAEERMKSRAQQAYVQFESEVRLSLSALDHAIRRLAAAPGERRLIWVSGGFLLLEMRFLSSETADRALRSNVVISALDPRGLATLLPMADATTESGIGNPRLTVGTRTQYALGRDSAASEVLREMTETTGGEYFHNNNDLDAGFRKVAAPPDVYYALAFSPQNLKMDGRFHRLKVQLVNRSGLTVVARSGYFAPKQPTDAKAQANEEISRAAFSFEELNELPASVDAQFFKASETEAQLAVIVRVDLRALRFRKDAETNANNLRIVTIIFDQDGNYVDGRDKKVELRLRERTLAKLLESGLQVRTRFKVRPGKYRIREVIRDSEGGQLAALNRSVEIPY